MLRGIAYVLASVLFYFLGVRIGRRLERRRVKKLLEQAFGQGQSRSVFRVWKTLHEDRDDLAPMDAEVSFSYEDDDK